MSADSPRRSIVAATVPPQVVSDRSILDSAIGFINDVTLTNQPHTDPKDTITWARFETAADISDPRFGEDWELEGNVAPPLLLILGYGLGVQVWAIPANGEAIEVLSWRHGIVSALRILPTPTSCSTSIDTHGRADEIVDIYAEKRPLIAIVDGSTATGSQPQFCAVNFVSLKTGSQVKAIKFKNPVLDILANRTSIVITFHERIAVFDARTLEDRLSITTCYPSPGINPNPVALGPRWLAYAEHKLLHSKRSGGGCDGEGVASYTATVLNAAKSLGKGLRELGEQVAAGLTGTSGSGCNSKNSSFDSQTGLEAKQPGVITILDIKHPIKDYSPTSGTPVSAHGTTTDPIVAHFIAHSEAVVAMDFDNSGMLLVTADRRGHDFHIFRVQPHPVGPSLAAVHHLYVLHRGDTSAKVQNITLSLDSRWVAVSTLRGTTHVFPITPYGGAMGVRTHTSLHVVNKLSRFHRSAGLSADGRSSSPISHSESTTFTQSLQPYNNATLPPFPRPTIVQPLTQLRQPFALGSPPGSAALSMGVGSSNSKAGGGSSSQRQRLSSLSDDSGKPLSVCAIFAKSRSCLLEPPNVTREAPHRIQRKAVDSLFVMAGHGALIQYDLDTKLASNVAKEKICDDTPIELEVEAKAQWNLGRRKEGSQEIMPPLSSDNWLIRDRNSCMLTDSTRQYDDNDDRGESWLSQVEIITHAGPHRRLWMGPQFVFKTYNAPSGSNLSLVDTEAVEIGVSKSTTSTTLARAERSSPLNIVGRSAVPVLIESGSYSSIEQSPKLMDRFRHDNLDSDFSIAHGDSRLKEDLADAMRESPSVSSHHRETGRMLLTDGGASSADNPTFYDALGEHDIDSYDQDTHNPADQSYEGIRSSSSITSAAALASVLPNISSYDTSSGYESMDSFRRPQKPSIEKIVNPLGTVTTITAGMSAEVKTDILDEVVSQLASEECVIHENCDEALFRPVVAIFCDENERRRSEEEARRTEQFCKPPELIDNKLIVPVIAKEVDAELVKKEKEKTGAKRQQQKNKEQLRLNEKKEQQIDGPKTTDTSGGGKCSVKVEVSDRATTNIKKEKVEPNQQKEAKEYKVRVVETKAKPTKATSTGDNGNPATKKSSNEQTKAVKPTETVKVSEKPAENIAKVEKSVDIKKSNKQQESEPPKNEKARSEDLKSKPTPAIESNKKEVTRSKSIESVVEKIDIVGQVEAPKAKPNTNNNSATEKNKENKDFGLLSADSPTKTGEIKAEHLNVADLADSLIELKEQNVKQGTEVLKKPVPNSLPIESRTPPAGKISKKKKRVQCIPSSNSNSETEEVVEAPITQKSKKSRQKELERKSSFSSDSSCAELTDSYTESLKPKTEESMFLSFLQTEEKKANKSTTAQKKEKVQSTKKENYEITEKTLVKAVESKLKITDNNDEVTTKPTKVSTEKPTTEDANKKETVAEKSENKEIKIKCNEEIAYIRKDTSKGAIKKEDKCETTSEDEIIVDAKSKVETNVVEKSNESKSPPKSPKKKGNEVEKVSAQSVILPIVPPKPTTTPTSTSSPVSVITKQPSISKKLPSDPASSFDETKAEQPANLKAQDAKLTQTKSNKTNEDNVDGTVKAKTDTTTMSLPQKSNNPTTNTPLPPVSPWKTLSGAELINRNMESLNKKSDAMNFPSLSKNLKSPKKNSANESSEKLLPDIPTPQKSPPDMKAPILITTNKAVKKSIKAELDDFPILNPLESLPPLPSLEPLEMLSKELKSVSNTLMQDTTSLLAEQVSLITFESPKQEDKLLERKIMPPPRNLDDRNLIFALCGSLHYENENTASARNENLPPPIPPRTRINMSIPPFIFNKEKEQKPIPNDKCLSSSPCSSASEEIIVLEEKKMTKKQKRKRQQLEMQKSESTPKSTPSTAVEVDEELCPLIGGMCDSQIYVDTMTSSEHFGVSSAPLLEVTSTTTTDSSDGPMPATTSDDNVFTLPITTTTSAQNKLKTKKLEHKINLIAAIEAATSSSTSSAEESGVEGNGGRASDTETCSYHHTPLSANTLISTSTTTTTSAMVALPSSMSVSAQLSATKKKTKRRKR